MRMVAAYKDSELTFKNELITILAGINNNLVKIGNILQLHEEDKCDGIINRDIYRNDLEKLQDYRHSHEGVPYFEFADYGGYDVLGPEFELDDEPEQEDAD